MPYLERGTLMLLIVIVTFGFSLVSSDDPFESLLVRIFCYGDSQKGCNKELTDEYPEVAWSHDTLTKATTHFYLFTKDNPAKPELLHKCAANVPPNTKFNPHCRTEIFIPGFVSGVCNFAIYRELKNERLKCGCYNVILVDWMWGNSFDLVEAVENMKIVAKQIAILIRNLKAKYGLKEDDFILTGHSLGAHGAGITSRLEKVGIINGLDPAGVVYSRNTPQNETLDAGDAKCVHVMHCNAGQCLPFYFGADFVTGTIDATFNDGLFQPACYPQLLISYAKGDFIYATESFLYPACSHFQCLQYYKASMCPPDDANQFLGIRCHNYDHLKSGKCKYCGNDGSRCAIVGAYACDCYSERSVKPMNKNFYMKTDLLCPFFDKSTVHKGGYTCQAASRQIQIRNMID